MDFNLYFNSLKDRNQIAGAAQDYSSLLVRDRIEDNPDGSDQHVQDTHFEDSVPPEHLCSDPAPGQEHQINQTIAGQRSGPHAQWNTIRKTKGRKYKYERLKEAKPVSAAVSECPEFGPTAQIN